MHARAVIIIIIIIVAIVAPRGAVGETQSRAQQRCITGLNRGGALIAVAAGDALTRCLGSAARGRLGAGRTIAACVAADRGLVRRESALRHAAKKACKSPPSFGPSTADAVADAFASMLHPEALFGVDLDAAVIDARRDRRGAACQKAVVQGMARVAAAQIREFNRCKAAGLRKGTIAAAADFAACLGSDPKDRVARARARGRARALRRCASTPVDRALPGECAREELPGLFACCERRATCDVCLAVTAADGVGGSCQRFRDGVATPYCGVRPATGQSVARQWDEEILEAIRHDTPRPTVHARNLFHLSAAMWDAWRAYGGGGIAFLTDESHASSDPEAARAAAISFAAYRIVSHRYALSVNAATTQAALDARMAILGYDKDFTTTTGDAPAAVGNRIASAIIAFGANDGANEAANYADPTYTPINAPLIVKQPGTVMVDPNRWQPLALDLIISQNGIPLPDKVQSAIGMRWNGVTPFALMRSDPNDVYIDPGPPPLLDLSRCADDPFKQAAVRVIELSGELTPDDGVMLDISPGAYGNNPLGTNDGTGHPMNPISGLAYDPQVVKRGDFGRVLAEFWADGPNSETPPGHWNVIANYVSDHPALGAKRIGGAGPVVSELEWDVKVYLAVNGAVHDAAIVAWGLKRKYDSVRPISMIRYLGGHGQCSDASGPSYDASGLPIVPGLIEVITPESSAPGERHAQLADHIGEIAIRTWPGQPADPATQYAGVQWIRAQTWVPYQKKTFVTPAFPGYTSGHSTFSRAAAEVLAEFTGSAYFPGGLAEFAVRADQGLTFERGPTTDVRLQWATYYDAADQAGQSRIWGGIHIQPDDFYGRRTGAEVGTNAWTKAQHYFAGAP
jgi:hypothetical protein